MTTARLTPATAALLTLPPLLWAGNAVVGRLVVDLVPPLTLNFLRWLLAFVLLLPLGGWVLRPGSGPSFAKGAMPHQASPRSLLRARAKPSNTTAAPIR